MTQSHSEVTEVTDWLALDQDCFLQLRLSDWCESLTKWSVVLVWSCNLNQICTVQMKLSGARCVQVPLSGLDVDLIVLAVNVTPARLPAAAMLLCSIVVWISAQTLFSTSHLVHELFYSTIRWNNGFKPAVWISHVMHTSHSSTQTKTGWVWAAQRDFYHLNSCLWHEKDYLHVFSVTS